MVEEHPEREVEDPGLVTDQEGLEGLPIAGTDRLQEHLILIAGRDLRERYAHAGGSLAPRRDGRCHVPWQPRHGDSTDGGCSGVVYRRSEGT